MSRIKGSPTRWIWTLQSPDGQIYRTDNLRAFLASKPYEFESPSSAYQTLTYIRNHLHDVSDRRRSYMGWVVIDVGPNVVSPKLVNLAGQRFGSLVVLYRTIGPTRTTWHCRCDCGAEKDVLATNLVEGNVTSCGCRATAKTAKIGKHQAGFVDLTGLRFGKLVAEFYDSRRRKWVCRCDCGGSCTLATTYLTNGSRTDCGCEAARAAGERVRAGLNGNVLGTNVNTIQHIMDGKLRATNTSGVTGITLVRRQYGTVYRARIVVRGKEIKLGTFPTMEAAVEARKAAEKKYFGKILEAYRSSAAPADPEPQKSSGKLAPLYSLRSARKAAGLKQSELAKMVGTSPVYVSMLETLRSSGSRAMREAIAAALGCTVEDLCSRQDSVDGKKG